MSIRGVGRGRSLAVVCAGLLPFGGLLGLAGVFASSAVASTPCVNQDSSLWVNCYDGSGHADDGARAIAISPDGSTVVVSGELTGALSGLDFGTEAINAQTGAR